MELLALVLFLSNRTATDTLEQGVSVAIFLSYNSLPLTTDTSTNIGETLFLFVIVFVYAMSFYFVFEKQISQSVRIVYLRKTRIARIRPPPWFKK